MSQKIEIEAGMVFDKLTVLEEDKDRQAQDIVNLGRTFGKYYKCRCECGKIITVAKSRLVGKRKVHSCGCSHDKAKKDLRGQVFNFLQVIDIDKSRPTGTGKHIYWICKCLKCENVVSVRSSDLISNQKIDCGCGNALRLSQGRFKDLTGEKFGHLTVISLDSTREPKRGTHFRWMVQCDICGKIESTTEELLRKLGKDRCRTCSKKSMGEQKIIELLNESNIAFVFDKPYKDFKYCDSNGKPRFDFRITQYSDCDYIIEYDGAQHYYPNIKYDKSTSFEIRKNRDRAKDEWCSKNNVPIIRIPYTQLNSLKIEDLQLETTSFQVAKDTNIEGNL